VGSFVFVATRHLKMGRNLLVKESKLPKKALEIATEFSKRGKSSKKR